MFILGTRVHNFTLPQALKKAESFLYDEGQHYIVTPNPEIILHAVRDPKYRSILNKASLSIPDGAGLIWASRILYSKEKALKERIAGVDFIYEFISHIYHWSDKPYKPRNILLLGGRNNASQKASYNLKKKFPCFNFYSLENTSNKNIAFLINEIIQPECIFIGLGAPKQEKWIREHLHKYPSVKVAMGVGGSFDFISKGVPRAPNILRRIGAEWLWRLVIEPRRANRIFNAAIVFPSIVLKEKAKSLSLKA